MFKDWKKRRDLQVKIAALKEEKEREAIAHAQATDRNDPEQRPFYFHQTYEIHALQKQLEELETDRLMRKVRKLGIQLPKESGWWIEDDSFEPIPLGDGTYEGKFYLADVGKAAVSRLIREEKRKSIEWWVTVIIVPILSTLIGLLGLLVALIAVSLSNPPSISN